VVAALGLSMIGLWHLANVGMLPPVGLLIKNAIITLPFTLTSILFIQTLSPMVISYRSREKSVEVARHKALRAMNIAFGVLFVTVFFYAVSFTLAMGHDEAVKAYEEYLCPGDRGAIYQRRRCGLGQNRQRNSQYLCRDDGILRRLSGLS
jgi:amino acid permease